MQTIIAGLRGATPCQSRMCFAFHGLQLLLSKLFFSSLHRRLQTFQATSNSSLVEHEILATKRSVMWQMNSIIAKVLKEIRNLPPSVSYSYPESVELTAVFQEGNKFM